MDAVIVIVTCLIVWFTLAVLWPEITDLIDKFKNGKF